MLIRSFIATVLFLLILGMMPGCSGGTYVETAPPTAENEIRPPAPPGQNVVWVPGHFVWEQGRYEWKPGYWIKGKPGKAYVPGHWKHTRRGYQWVPGHWN